MSKGECAQCGGAGKRECPFCQAKGCRQCGGTGKVQCPDCHGTGSR
jgi:hypothetical protein